MPIPVKTFGDFVVCFEATPETEPMRRHFLNSCGWTPAQYAKIRNFAWFTAEVSIWKRGVKFANDFIGHCCYKTPDEFFDEFEGDYFSDMVETCAQEIADAELSSAVATWRKAMKSTELAAVAAS